MLSDRLASFTERRRSSDMRAGLGALSAEARAGVFTREGGSEPEASPFVLHVSADFPDPIDSFKTPVIRTLLELTGDKFRHRVVSLNRRSPSFVDFGRDLISGLGTPRLSIESRRFEAGNALVYDAPARGLFHATMLRQLGDHLALELGGSCRPDLLVGHKLTIEGIAVRRAASRLGVPFAISIQGDTDTKVLDARPDLASEFGKVFHEAAIVFPFTPWALDRFQSRLGKRRGSTVLLPCPTDLDMAMAPRADGDGLISVFHLKNWRRKNLPGLLAAYRSLARSGVDTALTIVGGGSAADFAQARALSSELAKVAFPGALGRQEVRERMNRATAFVMPSKRETFGLVFVEALFAGLPVIYPKGQAIDGYFDQAPFAVGVDAGDGEAIAAAMRHVVEQETALKAELRAWQTSAAARRFTRPEIARTFAAGLSSAMSQL